MSPGRPPLEQGRLFDFELDTAKEEGETEAAEDRKDPVEEAEPPALDVPLERPGRRSPREPIASPEASDASEEPPAAPEVGTRFLAGGLDVALHLLLAGGVAGLLWLLGIPVGARTLGAVVLVLLVFSFFYTVVSLAFWGATLGMTALDLVAETNDEGGLAFGQAARRWLGGVVTVASAGLPGLLVFSGRSLGDRLSGSRLIQR